MKLLSAIVLIALGTTGCPEGSPEQAEGTDRSDATAADDAHPETGFMIEADVDHERRNTPLAAYTPASAGLCGGAPVDFVGSVVWTDATGLWQAPHVAAADQAPRRLATWEADEAPRSPAVVYGVSRSEPLLAVGTQRPGEARLYLFDRAGALVTTFVEPALDSVGATSAGLFIAWPLAGDGEALGHRVRWLDLRPDRPMLETALDAAPRTSAVRLGAGAIAGGGSHWLVGTDSGIVAIDDPLDGHVIGDDPDRAPNPRVVGAWSETGGVPTSLVLVHDASWRAFDVKEPALFVVVTLVDPTEVGAGLGQALRVLELEDPEDDGDFEFVPRTDIVMAPDRMTAHPVTIAGCKSVAGGGSHWYCPEGDIGALVTAGDGWIGAWGVPSGQPIFESPTTLRVSGLALGDGGWIAGGGSHWLPGVEDRWALEALHPGPTGHPLEHISVPLATGESAGACLPSPLWDTDGTLAVPIGGALGAQVARARLAPAPDRPTGGSRLGRGFVRPLGGNANTGLSVIDPGVCADGVPRDVHERVGTTVDEIVGVTPTFDGIFIYGGNPSGGFVRHLRADGSEVSLVVPEAVAVEHVVALGDGGIAFAYLTFVDVTPTIRLRFHDAELGERQRYDVVYDTGAFVGLTMSTPSRAELLFRGGSSDWIVPVSRAQGPLEPVTFTSPAHPIGFVRALPDGRDGLVVVLEDGSDTLRVRRLDAALNPVALGTWTAPGFVATSSHTSVDAAGNVRVMAFRVVPESGGDARWLRFDPDLALVADRPMPPSLAGAMATLPDGASLVSGPDGLMRVGPDDSFGLQHLVGPELVPLERGGVAASLGERGFVVGLRRIGGTGLDVVWARTDRHGFATCASAGQCVAVDALACDGAAVCQQRGCDPVSGQCADATPDGCAP